jgi:hypothetical protein
VGPATLLLTTLSCGEEHARGVVDPKTSSSSSPRLVECPTSETLTTQAIIGPLGGTVSLGGTSIRIPLGAVTVPTLITVTVPASRFVEVEVQANDLISFLFQTPVSITIDYSRCNRSDVDQAPLTVWYIDSATKEPLENMGGQDDKSRRRITFETGHLSGYAIAF